MKLFKVQQHYPVHESIKNKNDTAQHMKLFKVQKHYPVHEANKWKQYCPVYEAIQITTIVPRM